MFTEVDDENSNGRVPPPQSPVRRGSLKTISERGFRAEAAATVARSSRRTGNKNSAARQIASSFFSFFPPFFFLAMVVLNYTVIYTPLAAPYCGARICEWTDDGRRGGERRNWICRLKKLPSGSQSSWTVPCTYVRIYICTDTMGIVCCLHRWKDRAEFPRFGGGEEREEMCADEKMGKKS